MIRVKYKRRVARLLGDSARAEQLDRPRYGFEYAHFEMSVERWHV